MWIRRSLLILAIIMMTPALTVQASTLPTDFSESLIVGLNSLSRPTSFAIAPDGRLFITLQGDSGGGDVLIYQNGALLPDPLITVNTNSQYEHGLMGVTVDPDFATNGYIYLYYTTNDAAPEHRISRFTVTGNTASLASELVLIETDPIGVAQWHHGGELQFGPDGKLYIGFGDNLNNPQGGATSLPHYSQQLTSLFGKIVRINPDGSIPTDNPFYATATGKYRAIWAMGVRHPYKFSFRPTDSKMLFTEVGNTSWEEINEGVSGRNFGWPVTEGDFNPSLPANTGFTQPVYFYQHGSGNTRGCAITAGAFYNPPVRMFPTTYVGKFFFADYCNQWMKTYNPETDTATNFATATDPNVIAIEFNPVDGSMYYLVRTRQGETADNDTGHIYHMVYTGPQPPEFTVHPQDATVSITQTAMFSCSASGNPQPTYQWQRDGVNIPGATDDSYTTPPVTLADDGAQFRCVATNTVSATSNAATLTVEDNLPPAPTITLPKAGALYNAGQEITFKGVATDPEDGALPASAFNWSVAFHHGDHVHPFLSSITGVKTGTFTIPTAAHGDTNVWYRVYLTVTDTTGASGSTFMDVHPRVAQITVRTNLAGLTFNVDSAPHTAPLTWNEVVGTEHALDAPLSQMLSGSIYRFTGWSDDGPAAHVIAAPAADTVFRAIYEAIDVKNKSFENVDTDGALKQWLSSGLTKSDRQVCNQFDTGQCSFMMLGGADARSLRQTLALKGIAGDDLTLNFAVRAAAASGFVVRVTLVQNDLGTQSQDFPVSGDLAWQPQTLNIVATEGFTKVRVRIIANAGSAGRLWIDSLHLVKNN